MRIEFDKDKCTGHGRCYTLAPDVFRDDAEGYGEPIIEGELPAELVADAQLAANNCPELAIKVTG